MLEFLFATENLPFVVALGVMVGIGLLEGVTAVMGMGASSMIDALLPEVDLDVDVDVDLDPSVAEADLDFGDVASHGPIARALGWLHLGRVPVLVLMVIFLFAFGVLGLMVQGVTHRAVGNLLPGVAASLPALFGACVFVHYAGAALAKIIPKDETDAVSESSFIGRIAEITLGTARQGSPAQAKLRDEHGQTHYLMVEPDAEGEVFATRDAVLLVSRHGAVFRAIRNPNQALVD